MAMGLAAHQPYLLIGPAPMLTLDGEQDQAGVSRHLRGCGKEHRSLSKSIPGPRSTPSLHTL